MIRYEIVAIGIMPPSSAILINNNFFFISSTVIICMVAGYTTIELNHTEDIRVDVLFDTNQGVPRTRPPLCKDSAVSGPATILVSHASIHL